jgi:predicted acyl esterase
MTGPRTVKPPLIDRVFARRAGLQKPRPWQVETVRIPAADGTGLGADIYTPLGRSKGVLPAAHTFAAGHRIRLLIAGGSFPQFARSSGTGDNPLTATALHANNHTVRHAAGSSALQLPVAG